MSWTPTFWIRRGDYERIKGRVDADVWEFKIFDRDGVVMSGGVTSSAARELHDTIRRHNISHLLLDGEEDCCDIGSGWGEQIQVRE